MTSTTAFGPVRSPLLGVPLLLVGTALAATFVVTPLDLQAQAMLGGIVFVMALLLQRAQGRVATLALMALSVAVSSRYVYWRLSATMDLRGGLTGSNLFAVVLLGAELYTFAVLLLGYLQTSSPLSRRPVPMPEDPGDWPTVDVYIPTYNEPLDVVRATVLAAKALEWPADRLKVWILDDGRRKEFRDFARRMGVGYVVRSDNAHAKAGNINHALTTTRGEYIAIFDCDHVPVRSFLQVCMGWLLRDDRLAMVQTPHHFHTPDPFERNLGNFRAVPNEGRLFYGLLQPGNDLWNAVFFCGSCAVLRRTALEEVGGIAVETVTEDAHTALKMHRRGWRTAFLDIPQASGLATESLSAHVGQRIRWARGMVQIFRIDNPLLGRGLSLWQRLCYTSGMLHFFFGAPRLVFLLAPLGFLLFGAHIFNASPLLVIAYALPHLAHTAMTNARVQGGFRHSFWAEVYETALATYILLPTTLAMIAPSWGSFNVTAKGGITEKDWFDAKIAAPYLGILAVNVLGIAIGLYNLGNGFAERDAVLINVFWAVHNVGVLGATVGVAWERRQRRRFNRVAVKLPAVLHHEATGRCYAGHTVDLGLGGLQITGVSCEDLRPGEDLVVGLRLNHDELPLPARVLDQHGDCLRLAFERLSDVEEGWLVQAMFGRSDAWVTWNETDEPDRPMAALTRIWRHSLRTIPRTLRHLGVPRRGEVVG